MTDEPDELDLHAYVDNQLDEGSRFAVEAYLSKRPDLAARVMSDLSAKTGLRLLTRRSDPVPDVLMQQASSLANGRGAFWRRTMALSGLSIAAAVSWLVLTRDGPPAYVDMAISSHRVAMMRANMDSQVETRTLDHKELRSNAHIELPALPHDWNVTDVQLFPAGRNPALLVAIETSQGRKLSIFAVREVSDAPKIPQAVRDGNESVAFWRRGEMSYALMGKEDPGAIDQAAEALNESWS